MELGVYFDLRNPPGWPQDPARLHAFTLEMCEEAEHLGASSVWISEHHAFDDGYLPQPLTFAAAIAARTRRVRIGTAILVAPLYHPVHVAEQATVVDLVSDGRLDLGLGAGYRHKEFELFGADMDRRYSLTDGLALECLRLWRDGPITPRPVQDPVPVWLGYQGPKGARRAGRHGLGLLSANPELAAPYRAGLVEGGHDPASARMAGVLDAWVSDDPEADWPVVSRHVAYMWDSYRSHAVEGTGAPAPRPVDAERWRAKGLGHAGNFLLATPEDAAAQILAHVGDAPVETVYLWASIGGMPEELAARNVQTLATRLAPLLRAGSVQSVQSSNRLPSTQHGR